MEADKPRFGHLINHYIVYIVFASCCYIVTYNRSREIRGNINIVNKKAYKYLKIWLPVWINLLVGMGRDLSGWEWSVLCVCAQCPDIMQK